jgi:hypothetical protein
MLRIYHVDRTRTFRLLSERLAQLAAGGLPT